MKTGSVVKLKFSLSKYGVGRSTPPLGQGDQGDIATFLCWSEYQEDYMVVLIKNKICEMLFGDSRLSSRFWEVIT